MILEEAISSTSATLAMDDVRKKNAGYQIRNIGDAGSSEAISLVMVSLCKDNKWGLLCMEYGSQSIATLNLRDLVKNYFGKDWSIIDTQNLVKLQTTLQ
ncbi:hypothetical protein VNO77_00679 [Canavalia gladiata]|uniref:Uncharacterized protein n=1 Tax=Canavalia gladiata TaxID=3824 RepID=A0AAN9MQH3_CANGL